MKVGIIDYGMGNINSIIGVLEHLKVDSVIYSFEEKKLQNCDKLILPGVGAFNEAMIEINNRELEKTIKTLVKDNFKPILGICLGMQLLTSLSNENGTIEGLDLIKAKVKKFTNNSLKIPHVGFNQVKISSKSKLFKGIKDNSDFYFVHSYRIKKIEESITSTCSYGEEFISSFEKKNISGVQFHPELSQQNGIKLISNFLNNF
jgi:imidazole glycerol-phosphate synthase subunit HisH